MKTIVEITWDKPKEQGWLCPDNISLALHAYCKNTKFKVGEVGQDLSLLPKRGISKKMIEAELFIDACIAKNGQPPTYRQVQKHFGLKGVSSAYFRLRHCREKMIKRN